MSCPVKKPQRKRINNSKTLLPLQFRDISKKEFRTLSFDNMHKFYVATHAVNLEHHNFRKILYDAFFDALENKNGKIHRRDYLNEIEKFNNRYYQVADANDIEKIRRWKEYRESLEYQEFLRQVKQIDRLEHRADITISNALAYIYSQHQDKNLIYSAVETLEEKLKLNKIPELWSKSSLWFLANVAFFEQISFLAKIRKIPIAFDATQFLVKDLGLDIDIELNVRKDWWDNKFYYDLSDNEKMFYRIYSDVIVSSIGETGSVLLAEAARAGTSLVLHYGAKVLTGIATLHPGFRAAKVGAYILEGAKDILNNTVLGWLGWQIGVEWSLDGWIQSTMYRVGEALYRFTEGELFENAWNFTKITRSERYELMKDYFSEYKKLYEMLVNYYRSDKPHHLKEEIMNTLQKFNNYGDALGVRERTEKLVNKFMSTWRAFEARFRLHQLYEKAKREYDQLKNYTKQTLENYNKSIQTYCYDSSDKNAKILVDNQYKFHSSLIKKDYKHFLALAYASIHFREADAQDAISFLQTFDKIVDEHLKELDTLIKRLIYEDESIDYKDYILAKSKRVNDDLPRFYVISKVAKNYTFSFREYMWPSPSIVYPSIINDFLERKFKSFYIFTRIRFNCGFSSLWATEFSILVITEFVKKCVGVPRYTNPYRIQNLTYEDIDKLTFSFITDFKNNEEFLQSLSDQISLNFSKDIVSIPQLKIHNNLLKSVQRNTCFSVKRKYQTYSRKMFKDDLKRYYQNNYEAYMRARTYYLMWFWTSKYRGGSEKNYEKTISKQFNPDFDATIMRPRNIYFILNHIDTFNNKRVYMIKKCKLTDDKTKIKRKSKRSKVLCFVSSQK
jgi:hypothetical protein